MLPFTWGSFYHILSTDKDTLFLLWKRLMRIIVILFRDIKFVYWCVCTESYIFSPKVHYSSLLSYCIYWLYWFLLKFQKFHYFKFLLLKFKCFCHSTYFNFWYLLLVSILNILFCYTRHVFFFCFLLINCVNQVPGSFKQKHIHFNMMIN